MPMQRAVRVSTVDHALGVHTDMTQGNWSDIDTMIAQARYAGIDTMRVPVPVPGAWFASPVARLAEAGLKVEMVVDTSLSPQANAAAVAAFVKAHPGSLAFVEGPNEPSNWGVNYGGQGGMQGARLWQNDFYAAMNADPVTRDIVVSGPSSAVAAGSDLITIHPYARDGDQPEAWIVNDLANAQAADPGKGFVITETGYYTLPGNNPSGVDDATQAKLTVNTYLDAMRLGAVSVGFFALRDWANPDWDSYGLFYGDNSPKPAATALHNMQAILQDDGAKAASFAPGALDFANSVPADVRTLLMQKSSGEYVLALWREPDIWNEATQKPLASTSSSFTLKIGAGAEYSVYDPLLGTTAIRHETSASGLDLTMTDHPLFVSFTPGAAGSGTAAPATPVPVASTFGSGPDELVLRVSEDAWRGHAQFTVKVDGVQVGGEYSAFASHAAGGSDTLTLKGDWGTGAHQVEIAFTNDAWSGVATEDRNLYVDRITYDGLDVPASTVAMKSLGASQFSIAASSSRTLQGGDGADTLTGTAGNDVIRGMGGDDRLDGGAGNDRLEGGDGNDTLNGGTGSDTMAGGAGDDRYYVDHKADLVIEGANGGYDQVFASISYTLTDNVERLVLTGAALTGRGNEIDNTLVGNALNNTLYGMDGNDRLFGGGGDDVLVGGAGRDRLWGGSGADTFRFDSPAEGGDTILDFVSGVDIIEIAAARFQGGLAGDHGVLDAARFTTNNAGVATAPQGTGQFIFEADAARLLWDADGAGKAAPVLIATVSPGVSIHASDIHLI